MTPDIIVNGGPVQAIKPVSELSVNHDPNFNSVDFLVRAPVGEETENVRWSVHHSFVRWFYRDQPLHRIGGDMFADSMDVIADDEYVFVMPHGVMPGTVLGSVNLDLTFARSSITIF